MSKPLDWLVMLIVFLVAAPLVVCLALQLFTAFLPWVIIGLLLACLVAGTMSGLILLSRLESRGPPSDEPDQRPEPIRRPRRPGGE
jgi:predicted Na+-dependent transporter